MEIVGTLSYMETYIVTFSNVIQNIVVKLVRLFGDNTNILFGNNSVPEKHFVRGWNKSLQCVINNLGKNLT